MNEVDSPAFAPWTRRILASLLAGGLITAVYLILAPFIVPIAWALVLAHVTWPVHRWLRSATGWRSTVCALVMVACLGIALLLPLLYLIVIIEDNLIASYRTVAVYLSQGTDLLPDFIVRIPWLGEELQTWVSMHMATPAALNQQLTLWMRLGLGQLLNLFGGIGHNAAKLAFTLATLFVFYRDGETILHRVLLVLRSLLGARTDVYLHIAGDMNRAAVLGVILAALVQGSIASAGFWVVGVGVPVLLGALTAVASIIPLVGTFLIWGPICMWLLINGQPWHALGLLAWGCLLIHPADNLIRPLMISSAVRVPFLLVMFGVFGGIAAFGLIGLFLGPIILAVALAAWNEWVRSVGAMSDSAGQ